MNREKINLAIAPIAWTNDDMPELGAENTFQQCVSEMALAGFKGSEVGNKYPTDPEKLNKALKLRGLTICNAWFSSFLIEKDFDEVFAEFKEKLHFLKAVGSKMIGASEQSGSIQGLDKAIYGNEKPVYSDEQWQRLANGLNKLGAYALEQGMTLSYHHHMGTGVQTMDEIDQLMELTNPQYVNLLFDSGHAYAAGIDPAELYQKYASRIAHIHVKDVRDDVMKQAKQSDWSFLKAVREGVFTVPGDGIIDYKKVFKAFDNSDYEGWIVVEAEQDPAKANPLEYAIKARKFIRDELKL